MRRSFRNFVAILVTALALLLPCLAGASLAFASKKVAFVVGIDRYDSLDSSQQLRKAVNDARAVRASLAALGFEVAITENVGRLDLVRKWQQFLNHVQPGDVAAFFFAGHGVEIGGVNFLLPRDVPKVATGEEEVLKAAALSFNALMHQLRARQPQISLHIIDACRDNPFVESGGRSIGGSRGLARVEPATGTFVMFSAGAGQSALDRLSDDDPDPNSIYTRVLVKRFSEPGQSLPDIARSVRRDVIDLARSVSHVQTPAYYDEVIGRFCPGGCGGDAVSAAPAPSADPAWEPAAQAWAATKDTTSIAVLDAFIARFAGTVYADLAGARRNELSSRTASLAPEKTSPAGRATIGDFGRRGQIYRIGGWNLLMERIHDHERFTFIYVWTQDGRKGIEFNTGSSGWWRMWDGKNKLTIYSGGTLSDEKILQGDVFKLIKGTPIDVTGRNGEFSFVNRDYNNHTYTVRLRGEQLEVVLPDNGRMTIQAHSRSFTYHSPDGKKSLSY